MLSHITPFNFILACDGYKCNHWLELPEDVEYNYVNIVPRKVSPYANKIVAMGQTMLSSILASVRITEEMIDEAEIEITEQGYNFNRQGWEIICRMHGGRLPLRIFGVEEGRLVKPQTPIVGIVNTAPGFGWLPTYVESFSQSLVWKMSTVASVCRAARDMITEFCVMTGTDVNNVDYMLHNFGDRGADSPHEAAVIAAIAHAALFDGSDCIRANKFIKRLYGTPKPSTSSIEATEHSVMCAHSDSVNKDDWGAAIMAVDRLYARVESARQGIGLPFMSVVIDTFDSKRFTREYLGTRLKTRIEQSGGRLICRPDSGDSTKEPGEIGNILCERFGFIVNEKGYKVLPDCVGVIQGDGIRIGTMRSVLQGWVDAGMSMDNFCLGMGSGVTHDGARDDFSFSMKSTALFRKGKWEYSLKEPITDLGKKSLTGLVRCIEDKNGELEVIEAIQLGLIYNMFSSTPGWRLWYEDGYRIYRQSWDEVKRWARSIEKDPVDKK